MYLLTSSIAIEGDGDILLHSKMRLMRFLILGNGIYHLKLKKVTLLEYFAGLISVANSLNSFQSSVSFILNAMHLSHISSTGFDDFHN